MNRKGHIKPNHFIALSLIFLLLLGTITVMIIKTRDLNEKKDWNCEEITCGNIKFVDVEIIGGNYYVWKNKCEMLSCEVKE